MNDTEFDSWSEFEKMERRKAEDENLLREWERTNGVLRPVREFIEHVRQDIGVNGVITGVDVTAVSGGLEIAARYYMEKNDLPSMRASASNPGPATGPASGPASGPATATPPAEVPAQPAGYPGALGTPIRRNRGETLGYAEQVGTGYAPPGEFAIG